MRPRRPDWACGLMVTPCRRGSGGGNN
jgi:hypothetical protein